MLPKLFKHQAPNCRSTIYSSLWRREFTKNHASVCDAHSGDSHRIPPGPPNPFPSEVSELGPIISMQTNHPSCTQIWGHTDYRKKLWQQATQTGFGNKKHCRHEGRKERTQISPHRVFWLVLFTTRRATLLACGSRGAVLALASLMAPLPRSYHTQA